MVCYPGYDYMTRLYDLTSPSPHPHLTSPHLTSPHLTSPHLATLLFYPFCYPFVLRFPQARDKFMSTSAWRDEAGVDGVSVNEDVLAVVQKVLPMWTGAWVGFTPDGSPVQVRRVTCPWVTWYTGYMVHMIHMV